MALNTQLPRKRAKSPWKFNIRKRVKSEEEVADSFIGNCEPKAITSIFSVKEKKYMIEDLFERMKNLKDLMYSTNEQLSCLLVTIDTKESNNN